MNEKNENFLTLTKLKELFLDNIWLFLGGLVLTLGIALVYIVITPPIYQRQASVLIKDDLQGKSINSQMAQSFEDMGLFKSNTNINNEINVLRTPLLMVEVVRRLKMDHNYSVRFRNVRWVDIYNATPVKVELDNIFMNGPFRFRIKIESDTDYTLDQFEINHEEADLTLHGKFGDMMETVYGKLRIVSTEVFTEKSIGMDLYFMKTPVESVVSSLLQRLTVGLKEEGTSIIDLSLTDEVPLRAEDILNTLISVYNENWIKDRNMITLSTSQFINERLKVIEQELGGVDDDISAYKSRNLLPDVAAVAHLQLEQSKVNTSWQLSLSNQLSMAQYIKQYMQGATTRDRLLPANSGIESGAIEAQIARYNELLLQKNNLLSNSSESNPIVADMITKLNSMKEIIMISIEDLIGSLTVQIDNARQEALVNDARLATNPTQAKYLLSVERQQKVKEELYLFLLQKREEIELSQAFTAYNTRILVPAEGSKVQVEPRKMQILLVALIAGFLLPLFYLLLKEMTDTLVRDKQDLEELTIPFVGSIPALSKKVAKPNPDAPYNAQVVIEDKNRDMVNEAFRIIRTNIDFMANGEKKSKVLMFTSYLPGSGKSFISANLAISEAIKGAKVLVIDADLRKASVSTYVGSPKEGLSNYLNGKIENVDDVIVKGQLHPNMDMLPAGMIPPNPSELLLTERFGKLIADLREKYDYIYLDCTPIEIVPDASIVVGHCDMSVFVIRAGLLDKRLLPELEEFYRKRKYREMCVILNGVHYTNKSQYRRYGYGTYGYGLQEK